MKETILSTIYSCFEEWARDEQFCCKAGCATCCTADVTITALEGQRILKYCQNEGLLKWLGKKLVHVSPQKAPELTTNEFVSAVLNEQPVPNSNKHPEGKCLFLQNDQCRIYPIRPFSCRCFASTTPCAINNSATVSDTYLYGSTAAMQIIEHLGQFDFWGLMTDILVQQAHHNGYIEMAQPKLHGQAKTRLRRAHPLPGFIFSEEEHRDITFLLQSIFTSQIGARTIEQILNGNTKC